MSERLRRLLLVVPAARARPGIALAELASMLQCTPDELRQDIDLLACVGAPPFNPDDLIDIELRDDRVYVSLPHAFDRPTRLAATEAAALAAAARALAPNDAVLSRAVAKLDAAIAPAQKALYEALVARIATVPEEERADVVAACQTAARERRVLEIDYFARTELTSRPRRVKPRAIAAIDGVRYLSAQNDSGQERTYRLDRIAAARVSDELFAALPPIDLEAQLVKVIGLETSAELPRATVRFSAKVADAARSRHAHAQASGDGVEALVPYSTVPWLVSYALSWGGEADVLAPPAAREAFLAAVRGALEAHAG